MFFFLEILSLNSIMLNFYYFVSYINCIKVLIKKLTERACKVEYELVAKGLLCEPIHLSNGTPQIAIT